MPNRPTTVTERHVLTLGLAAAAAFVVAALVAAATALSNGGPTWPALHLALAGGALVAIGTFMPHFAVTLAGTRPAPPPQRLAALGLLSAGAISVVWGVSGAAPWLAGMGAAAISGGLGMVAAQIVAPLREPLARRHPIVSAAYGIALAELACGVVLGGLAAIGWPPVVGAWASLRPAHAWLNLFGAVSLTIFATLVYLAPTVLGARIRASRAMVIATVGLVAGPLVTALGFALDARAVAIGGAVVTTAGATGQLAYLADTWLRRGPYTSEHDWRRVAVWHLGLGAAWFWLALVAALVGLGTGSRLAGWELGTLAVPMVGGWMLQELVGSWTHLAPSVTPGDAARHASQRRVLAAGGRLRLVAWNAGVAALWLGVLAAWPGASLLGAILLAGAALLSVALLVRILVMTAPLRSDS
jgi:hypothetical protein